MKTKVKIVLGALLMVVSLNISAQSLIRKGTVTDNEGYSLPGANIIIMGSNKGVTSELDGSYSIEASNDDVLIFSYIGYETREETVGDRFQIDVMLVESKAVLDEVVVVAYGKQKKVTNTGAVTAIQQEDLLKSPNASIANSLAGKVTGLSTVQFSGQPGEDDPSIYVRGVSSLFEERAQPLMLVDGVERSFLQLDPNEIESISVLKDASATAVFGVRGANGAIIVTTRRGEEGKARISANFSTGIQLPTSLLDFTDSYTYGMMYNEAQRNDDPALTNEQLRFSAEALEAFKSGSQPIIYPDTDWLNYIMKSQAMQSKANINISGGTKEVKYFLALGYLKQDGLFNTFDTEYDYNFGFNRFNYRSNIDIDLTKYTKIGISAGGRVGTKNRPNSDDFNHFFRKIYWAVPFSGPGIVDGKYIKIGTEYISDQKKDGLTEFYGKGYQNLTSNNLNFDIDLQQKLDFLIQGLSFRTKYSYNSQYSHNKIRNSSVPYYEPYYLRDLDSSIDPSNDTIVYRKIGTLGNLSYSESSGKGRNFYFDAGLHYGRSFGLHDVSGLLLYNQNKVFYPGQFSYIPTGLVGLVGRATYNYNTKYLFDLNLGYNGSENFSEEKRFGIFPAISAGWIISEEEFIPKSNFLNYLKVRASFGVVGNDKIGANRFLYLPDSYDASANGYNFGTNVPSNQEGSSEGMIGNPLVTWETAYKQNYGLDAQLLNDHLGINFDYFIENRKDILTFRQTVPGILSIDLPAENIGEVLNKGFEIQVKWNQQLSPTFKFWVNANMSHARNKIIFMDEIPQAEDYLYKTGHPVNQYFGFEFDRFLDEGEDISEIPDHQYDIKPGDMIYKDLNGDGIIDHNDQKAIGHTVYPENTYGANLGFSFKNFDFSIYLVGASHTSRMLDETFRIAFGNTLNRSLLQYMADERWTPETASTASFPRMTLTGSLNNSKDSDFWLRDASYIRIKNLELSYKFKLGHSGKDSGNTIRVYLNGYNLLTWDKIKITDPESKTGSTPEYPLVRIINGGIKITI